MEKIAQEIIGLSGFMEFIRFDLGEILPRKAASAHRGSCASLSIHRFQGDNASALHQALWDTCDTRHQNARTLHYLPQMSAESSKRIDAAVPSSLRKSCSTKFISLVSASCESRPISGVRYSASTRGSSQL